MILKARETETYEVTKESLKKIADFAPSDWQTLAQGQRPDDRDLIKGATEPELAKYLIDPHATAIEPERWARLLDRWAREAHTPPLVTAARDRVARAMSETFAISLREGIKHAWVAGDKAWPAFQLDLAALLAERVKQGIDTQREDWKRELATLLNGLHGLTPLLDALSKDERERHTVVLNRFDAVAKRLDDIKSQLGQMHADVRAIAEILDRQSERYGVPQSMEEKDRRIRELESALRIAQAAAAGGDTEAEQAIQAARDSGDMERLQKTIVRLADEHYRKETDAYLDRCREVAAIAYLRVDMVEAERRLLIILGQHPEDLDAINRLGHIYLLRGDFAAAERQYQKLLALAGNDGAWQSTANKNLRNVYGTRRDLEGAGPWAKAGADPGGYGLKIYKVSSDLYPFVQVYFRTFDHYQLPLVNLNERNIGLMVRGQSYALMKLQHRIQSLRQRQEATRSVLVIDASHSLAGWSFKPPLWAAAHFVDSKRPQDEVAVLAIRDTKEGYEIVSQFERDPIALGHRLANIKADGVKSRVYDSIAAAIQLCDISGRGTVNPSAGDIVVSCAIVALTDGMDEGSAISQKELVAQITGLKIPPPVYSLVYSKLVDIYFRNLVAISKNSFGMYYRLGEPMDDIGRSQCRSRTFFRAIMWSLSDPICL